MTHDWELCAGGMYHIAGRRATGEIPAGAPASERGVALDVAQQDSAALEYEPAGPRRVRVRWRWVIVILLAIVAGAAYWWRAELSQRWLRGRLLYAQHRCLTFPNDADRVVYDDDPAAAKELLARGGYVEISGAACAASPRWDDLFTRLGRSTFLWPDVAPGATVFLHELRTPDGRRVLIHVTASPAGKDERLFTVMAINPGTWTTIPDYEIGLRTEATFALGFWDTTDPHLFIPIRPEQRLRLYAGTIDPSHASRVIIPFEIDGRRGRFAFQVLPDTNRPGRLTIKTESLDRPVVVRRNASKLP